MPKDLIYIGPTPAEEACEQVGPNFDSIRARIQCETYIGQLRRMFGEEPDGARLAIKNESGPEVVCYFDGEKPASIDYAFKCEGESPANWDDPALTRLSKRYPEYLERLKSKELTSTWTAYADLPDSTIFTHNGDLCVKYDYLGYAIIGKFENGACRYVWPKKDQPTMLQPMEHQQVQVKVISLD